MIIWILAAALTAVCVLVLLNSLLRQRTEIGPRSAFDLSVYKDQLTEVERDMDRGLLNETQARSARLEIERRMLAATAGDEEGKEAAEASENAKKTDRWMAWFIAAALPGLALGLYLNLGSPDQPGVPLSDRRALESAFREAVTGGTLETDIAALETRVTAQGFDPHAWLLLAGAYGQLGRYIDSANAYRRAIDQGAKEAQIYASLGEALVAASGGEVGTEARRAFGEAIKLDGGNMKSFYYTGLAMVQEGRLTEALDIWRVLFQRSAPGTPWRPLLEQRIAQIEAALAEQTGQPQGQGEAAIPWDQAAGGSGMPLPSAADVEAAGQMSPKNRWPLSAPWWTVLPSVWTASRPTWRAGCVWPGPTPFWRNRPRRARRLTGRPRPLPDSRKKPRPRRPLPEPGANWGFRPDQA